VTDSGPILMTSNKAIYIIDIEYDVFYDYLSYGLWCIILITVGKSN